jgi:LacI family transcriptional regulator
MANIRDVAKRAGVAPITVSRYINNSGYCSLEARNRIKAAIAELGYIPNRLASGLRSKHTNTLALVLTDITNPFFTTIARGVEDTASDAGYTVIFCNTDESVSEEQKYLHMLLEQRVDGILLVPALSTSDSVSFIQAHNTPIVVLDRRVSGVKVDVVRCDSEMGAYELTRLLLSLGHRHISILSGPMGVSTAEDRVAGCQRALSEADIQDHGWQKYYGLFTQQSGYEMTCKALANSPKPTALFAANNFIAIGALKAMQDLGVRVPEDVALVGFDDLPPALITFPFLTVAAQPAYEMGRKATRILLDKISAEAADEFQEVILPADIVVRRSSGQVIG